MNKRSVGFEQEKRASEYLEEMGYVITDRNFYCHFGEIDIIAYDEAYIVFVEVKYRKDVSNGMPEEAVDYRKQRKIYKSAEYYMHKNHINTDVPCRFDVVALDDYEIRLYKNAFGGM